jgi:uncharacterized protein
VDKLIEKYRKKITNTDLGFIRSIVSKINWDARLVGIKGSRGIGKTTLLLQYIKLHFSKDLSSALYVSLDDIWFSENSLSGLAENFVKQGGKYLFLDEVHKYPQWSVEVKNIYDDYPELKTVFTGSSLLEILNARADLSRRAVVYEMQGLSFREYLIMESAKALEQYTLDDIIKKHEHLAQDVLGQLKPFKYFSDYLEYGYYPFYREQKELYHMRLEEILNMILEVELPVTKKVNVAYVRKIKQLLYAISESAPFIPNISKLSKRIGIQRETLLTYLFYLDEANILHSVYKDAKGITILQKPDKIFMENTNLMFTLQGSNIDKGNLRETFFMNQLKSQHQVEIPPKGDFIIDNKYTFEIGGKSKNKKQIQDLTNAFIATDDIELGYANKIPLWLFGFLY